MTTSDKSTPTGLRKGLTNYGDAAFSLYLRKAFIKAAGYSDDALDRPIVGITNTASDYNPCHGNVPDLIESVKRGVLLSGALPMVFPTISIAESFAHPTSMFLRNLLAMDTEEMIRAQPMDSVALIGGCDKNLPAQVMAAVSANLPAIVLPTGPMLTGHYKGEVLGACTDCRRFWAQHRAGTIDVAEIELISGRLCPTVGTCSSMGTASTMALLVEALGLSLPMSAAAPAVSADRRRIAESTGRRAAELAASHGPTPADILSPAALRNAMIVLQAIGGSTNGLIHLTAIAQRAGLPFDLAEFDRLSREVPVLLNLKPSGTHYMEHLHQAGGLPALLRELNPLLDTSVRTISGFSFAEIIDESETVPNQDVIRPLTSPLKKEGAMAVLRGNLSPDSAVIKHSAASPHLLRHTGRAVVFDSLEDLANRIDAPDLDVHADDVLVLRNAGPIGAPGMPEAGYLPIPLKLARAGVKDMVRISDARMSGTAFGTIVLHIAPESAIGGPLAVVRTGDRIALDVEARRIDLLVDEAELATRIAAWHAAPPRELPTRGYARLFHDHILQAPEGCDFDFLLRDRPPKP
ncbi:MAG TPA: IlvD/Edd family dehydratase [Acidobacteriaceae bacterium]|jgi:dihydroxy-acid dehydratase